MITEIVERNRGLNSNGTTGFESEFRGLSSDAKPTSCINGSVFLEMDTGKVFMYNSDGTAWVEL